MNKTNSQGIITDSLGYTGIVTLSQKVGKKKVKIAQLHNAGGKALFEYLAACLAGDFDTAKLNRPTKIMLLSHDSDNKIIKAKDTPFIHIITAPKIAYSSEIEGVVEYSFTISQDIFSGTAFDAVGLYTNTATEQDVENYAAYCPIASEDLTDISLSSVLLLDWELHISN